MINHHLCRFWALLTTSSAAAPVQEVWSRLDSSAGNSSARALTVDPQGNVYVTGYSNNAANNSSDFSHATAIHGSKIIDPGPGPSPGHAIFPPGEVVWCTAPSVNPNN